MHNGAKTFFGVGLLYFTSSILTKISSLHRIHARVSVQGVKSLGDHFACLCRGFDFYEVKKNCNYFSKREGKYTFTLVIIFIVKTSKRAK